MPGFGAESYDTIVPRTFRMKHVEIDPRTLETEAASQEKDQPREIPMALEKEMPQAEKVSLATAPKNLLSKPQGSLPVEKPDARMPAPSMESILLKAEKESVFSSENYHQQKEGEALKLPILPTQETGTAGNPGETHQGKQQFSSLDDLLANSGMVKRNTAPILMPTDLLFEYDSDALKEQATETLSKLGSLIKKNEQASFRIEGHTDSFGSDDYNMQLSLRRAEAVKTWLKNTMGLDAARISTVGLGKRRLLFPASGTVDQQQINRRVEIVISLPKETLN